MDDGSNHKEIGERQRSASPTRRESATEQGRREIKEWDKAAQQRMAKGQLSDEERKARIMALLGDSSAQKAEPALYSREEIPQNFRIVEEKVSWATLKPNEQQSSSDSLSSAINKGKNRDHAGDNTHNGEKLLNTILKHERAIRENATTLYHQSSGDKKQQAEQIKIAADKLALVNNKISSQNVSRYQNKYPNADISKSKEYATIIYKTLNTPDLTNHFKKLRTRINKEMEL